MTDSALISPSELMQALTHGRLRILDASWHMPAEKRDARTEFAAGHIPGAVFFDIDAISDQTSIYPHMLPSPEAFAASLSKLGVSNADDVVVYDTNGIFSSARAWWMLRVFGHDRVRVLDGGLPAWKAAGGPLEPGNPAPVPAVFNSAFKPELLRTRQQVQANCAASKELLIDARPPGRFSGAEPEPRPNLARGHIEGSINLFFKDVLTDRGTLKPRPALCQLFEEKGIDPARPLAATCGSGVTACILALAFFEAGNRSVPVYDGAWAEWGNLS